MRSGLFSYLVLPLLLLPVARQLPAQTAPPAWPNGSVDLNAGWRSQSGDNLGWALPALDDTQWSPIALTQSNQNTGWRWYRLHKEIPVSTSPLALLITGGDGTYEVYLNGRLLPGPQLRPDRLVSYARTQVVPLPPVSGHAVIALRTRIPTTSMFLADRGTFRVALGTVPAVRDAATADFLNRFESSVASLAAFLLICSAAISLLFLFWNQPGHREYLWVGCYMLMEAISQLTFNLANSALVPFSVQWFGGSSAVYATVIFQIEFTFSFVGQRVPPGWRIYQAIVVAYPACLLLPAWFGWLSRGAFDLGEMALILPAALALPILLFRWYRRGNREAGWLILPSLLPIITVVLTDLSIFGMAFHYAGLAALSNSISFGPFEVRQFEAADILFVVAIGIVMFFRFTSVSRDQARAASEFEAAQRVQSLLLRCQQSANARFRIESVYRPAQEVGGDFFHTVQIGDLTRIVVGDVSGKGMGAAMLVSVLLGALDAIRDASPAAVLHHLNNILLARQQGGFATCLCAQADPDGVLTIANAGHLAPYRNGEEVPVESGLPLGIMPDVTYPETAVRLAPRDCLTFVSDGVLEAQSASGELFGFERTRQISTQSAEAIARAAQAFGQQDDITVFTFTFAETESESVYA